MILIALALAVVVTGVRWLTYPESIRHEGGYPFATARYEHPTWFGIDLIENQALVLSGTFAVTFAIVLGVLLLLVWSIRGQQ